MAGPQRDDAGDVYRVDSGVRCVLMLVSQAAICSSGAPGGPRPLGSSPHHRPVAHDLQDTPVSGSTSTMSCDKWIAVTVDAARPLDCIAATRQPLPVTPAARDPLAAASSPLQLNSLMICWGSQGVCAGLYA